MELTQYEAIALLIQNPQPQRMKDFTEEVLLRGSASTSHALHNKASAQ
jgi:hypothetical protein